MAPAEFYSKNDGSLFLLFDDFGWRAVFQSCLPGFGLLDGALAFQLEQPGQHLIADFIRPAIDTAGV